MSALNQTPPHSAPVALTRVTLVHFNTRVQVWLRFGNACAEMRFNRVRRVLAFAPGALFCRVHWEANAHGTTLWKLAIMQAGNAGDALQRVIGVQPGAHLLLEVSGHNNVQRVLHLIGEIETLDIAAVDVAPAYWLTVHNRIVTRLPIPPYTAARHAAHLQRSLYT